MATPTSLREWLARLQQQELLAVVDRPVSPRFELAAVAKQLDGRRAAFFRNVDGFTWPVVAGTATTRAMFADACGCDQMRLLDRFNKAAGSPRACREVETGEAPVHETVLTAEIDVGRMLPMPVHHERDAGPYITAGLFIVRDPTTRKQNVSIHRLLPVGPTRFTALILPRHTHVLHERAETAGKPLPCAVVIGADPVTMLASQAHVPFGVDELEVASALHDRPLEVVRCKTVDIDVPASAEIVLEGHILPNVREPEGPFGEFPKYYGPASNKEVVEIAAVTHRHNPIFQTILPAGMEHLLLGAIPREASLLRALQGRFPGVRAVHMTPGGACRYHAVVSMTKSVEGQAKNVILATLADNFDIKHVFVVDADVDIFQPDEVEWALATRFQGDRGLVVINGAQASSLDPSSEGRLGTKLGFDCTVPLGADPERFRRISIPGFEDVRLADYIAPRARVEFD